MDAIVAKDLVEIGRIYTNKKYSCEQLDCRDVSKAVMLRRIEIQSGAPIRERTVEEEILNVIRLRPFDDLKFFTVKELSTVGIGKTKSEIIDSIAVKFGINRVITPMESTIGKIKEKGIQVVNKYSKQKLMRIFELDSRLTKNEMIERIKEMCEVEGGANNKSELASLKILRSIESSGVGMWRQFDKRELAKAFGLPLDISKEEVIQNIYELHSTPTMLKHLFDDFNIRLERDYSLSTALQHSNKSVFKKLFISSDIPMNVKADKVIKLFKRHLRNELEEYLSKISTEESNAIDNQQIPKSVLFLNNYFNIRLLNLSARKHLIDNMIKILDHHDYSILEMCLNTINDFSSKLININESIENIDLMQIDTNRVFTFDPTKLSVDIIEKLLLGYRFKQRTGPVKRTVKHIDIHDFRNNNFNYRDFERFETDPVFYKYKINDSKKEYLPQDFIYRLNQNQLKKLCHRFWYPTNESEQTMAHFLQWTERFSLNYMMLKLVVDKRLSENFYNQFMIKYNCSLDAAKFALLSGDLITKDLYDPSPLNSQRHYNEQVQVLYLNFYHEDNYYSPMEIVSMKPKLPFEDLLLKWCTDKTNDLYLCDLYETFGLSCPYNISADSYLPDALKTIKYYTTRNRYPDLDFQFKNDILLDKLYTLSDRELLKIYPVNDHTSRENLIHKIYNLAGKKMIDLVDNTSECVNNSLDDIRSINVFTGTERISTPDDPLIIYGYPLNRMCMNLDEILASIVFEYTDAAGRKKKSYPLRNPIDPNQFFDRDELMTISGLISHRCLKNPNSSLLIKYAQLSEIVDNCLNTKVIIQEFIDRYTSMIAEERELCDHVIYLVFIIGLYIRYWEGPEKNYPYKFEERCETEKQSRELKITVLLCYLKEKLSKSEKVKEYFNSIPFIDYNFTNDRYSLGLQQLSTILELASQPETFCLAHASDICFETSYFVLKNILHKSLLDINREMDYHHRVLSDEILADSHWKELFMIQNKKFLYTINPKEICKSSHRDPTNALKKAN